MAFFLKIMLLIGLVFVLQACSNQQLYQAVNNSARQQCLNLPQSEVQECLDRNNTSYDGYQRQKGEIK